MSSASVNVDTPTPAQPTKCGIPTCAGVSIDPAQSTKCGIPTCAGASVDPPTRTAHSTKCGIPTSAGVSALSLGYGSHAHATTIGTTQAAPAGGANHMHMTVMLSKGR